MGKIIASAHKRISRESPFSAGLIATRQRIWECDDVKYPERSDKDWVDRINQAKAGRLLRVERHGIELAVETHNMVMDQGMETIARIIHGGIIAPPAWATGRWYKQGVGSCPTDEDRTDKKLGVELFRKSFTDSTRIGRVVTTSTFFSASDYVNARTTVASGGTVSGATLTSPAGFQTDDYVRIGSVAGYDYRKITLVGSVITFDTPIAVAPPNGTTIDQMTEEAMIFGDESANYTDGTALFTGGSPIVTGSGTAWLARVGAGDMIRVGSAKKYYEILTVDSDTQITLTANFAETTTLSVAYVLKGTAWNHANGLRYLKGPRGFVYENQWTIGG